MYRLYQSMFIDYIYRCSSTIKHSIGIGLLENIDLLSIKWKIEHAYNYTRSTIPSAQFFVWRQWFFKWCLCEKRFSHTIHWNSFSTPHSNFMCLYRGDPNKIQLKKIWKFSQHTAFEFTCLVTENNRKERALIELNLCAK